LGYWGQPKLTDAKFKPDPQDPAKRLYFTGDLGSILADGCLVYQGRKDFRIKIRGYGVDLVEVEKALLSNSSVNEAVVLARIGDDGSTSLTAYYTSAQPQALSALRSHLKTRLSDYMIPSAFMRVEKFPLASNGKVDRKALPKPDKKRPELGTAYVEPRDDREKRMVGAWEEVLDIRPIGIDDNFFDLGGHSLVAARLFTRMDDEFQRLLPLSFLIRSPTVRLLTEQFRSKSEAKKISALVPFVETGNHPAIFAVPGVYGNVVGLNDLCRELGTEQPFYGLQSIGLDGLERPIDNMEEMAGRYIREVRTIQPHGPYNFIGACFGSTVAWEMVCQLMEAGEEISFLGLLDPIRMAKAQKGLRLGREVAAAVLTPPSNGFVTSRLKLYFDEMRNLNNYDRARFVATKAISLGRKIGDRKVFRGVRREMHQLAVLKANRAAGDRYRPRRLTGRLRALEVFVSGHQRKTSIEALNWQALWEGKSELHHMPGRDSGDMLSGENARVLGALLRERLRAAMNDRALK
jgi:thioesterase domain-containing protein